MYKRQIVDETTTALSQKGRDILYAIIGRMREENKTVIFISHDLEEVMDKCDTISVMRDGSYVDTLAVKECTPCLLYTSSGPYKNWLPTTNQNS